MEEVCTTCFKQLEYKKKGSACRCLIGTMFCYKCEQIVGRTGNDSDGVGIFRHDPCGLMIEHDMGDPRVMGFFQSVPDEGERGPITSSGAFQFHSSDEVMPENEDVKFDDDE